MTLSGLSVFNNAGGVIEMNNTPVPDDNRIILANYSNTTNPGAPTVVFSGTGNSRLWVDASLGGPGSRSDVLQVGLGGTTVPTALGYVTGLTHITVVHDTGPVLGVYNPVGIPVVESSGAANTTTIAGAPVTVANGAGQMVANAPSNFDLPQGPIVKGLFQYNLFYLPQDATGNPCTNSFNCWFLASTPSTVGLELPRLMTAAQDIFADTAGLWLDRNADLRDYFFAPAAAPVRAMGFTDEEKVAADMLTKAPPMAAPAGVGPGVWFRAFGDWTTNNGTANYSAFGQVLPHDVNYKQDTGGAQVGIDYAANKYGYTPILFGALLGAVRLDREVCLGNEGDVQGRQRGRLCDHPAPGTSSPMRCSWPTS